MPSKEEIAAVIPRLGRGARVKLILADDSETVGRLYGLFDGLVYLEEDGAAPVALERITDLLVETHSSDLPNTMP